MWVAKTEIADLPALHSQPMVTYAKDGQAEQAPPQKGELKITQDVFPSGLGLMPRSWARRIAKIALRVTSSHG